MGEAHIIRHDKGEFSLAEHGRHLRLRWQADDGYWRAVYLDQGHVIEAARFLVAQAEKMPRNARPVGPLHCSFCGKSQSEVKKLIAGPTVFICDECAVACVDIVKEGSDA